MNKRKKEKTIDVVVVGDILIDNIYWVEKLPKSGEDKSINKFIKRSGGSAANTVGILGRLGIKSSFISQVGKDDVGDRLVKSMEKLDINLECLQYGGATGYTITLVEKDGERTMLSYRDASSASLVVNDKACKLIKEARVLYISGYMLSNSDQANYILEIAKIAKENGTIVMLDTAPIIASVNKNIIRKMLSLTDILMPNEAELLAVTGKEDIEEGIKDILERVPMLVLKRGGKGAILVGRNKDEIYFPNEKLEELKYESTPSPVEVINTTGAGDSFNGGFIASYIKGNDPLKCLEDGNHIASQVISNNMSVDLFS